MSPTGGNVPNHLTVPVISTSGNNQENDTGYHLLTKPATNVQNSTGINTLSPTERRMASSMNGRDTDSLIIQDNISDHTIHYRGYSRWNILCLSYCIQHVLSTISLHTINISNWNTLLILSIQG